jgi:uncharacterized protein YcfJ
MKILLTAAMTASIALAGLTAAPAMAQDYGYQGNYGYERGYDDDRGDYRRDRRDYRDGYDIRRAPRQAYRHNDRRCRTGSTGTIVGAVAGALLGGEIGRGGYYNRRSATGTILGAGVGALVGREIDRGDCRQDRRYRR